MANLLRLLWHFILDCLRSPEQLKAKDAVLRNQLNILRRKAPKRPILSNKNRVLFGWLYQICPSIALAGTIMRPDTAIGSIRRECLDHVVVRSAGHLRRVLTDYVTYYNTTCNTTRTHLGLREDAPKHRPVERRGRIIGRDIVGGLHHQYRPI